MSVISEFETVDLIVNSNSETRGVDAFALSLIKSERQLRKLFTHLVFQYPCFKIEDVKKLRKVLASNGSIYFEGIEAGINEISQHAVGELVGADYTKLRARMDNAISYRNKIFHGQLTHQELSRGDLLAYVNDMRAWCNALAEGAFEYVGYDGFGRDSFQKSEKIEIWKTYKKEILSIGGYAEFLKNNCQRPLKKKA